VASRFQEALHHNPAPKRIGTLRLRYEESMLLGQTVRPLSPLDWLPEALMAVGFGLGLIALISLLIPRTGNAWPVSLGVLAALAVLAAVRLDSVRATPLRFVLNFTNDTLRIDAAGRGRFRRQTIVVPFDNVTDVEVSQLEDGRFGIVLHCQAGSEAPHAFVLTRGVSPDNVDELRKFWRFLRSALGLKS
jgi:hypothetical protein